MAKISPDRNISIFQHFEVYFLKKNFAFVQVERWTNRTNQLVAQSAKAENEEVKKLQSSKMQNEKTILALQEDVKRTKQQLDLVKRESLKLKTEKTENQVRNLRNNYSQVTGCSLKSSFVNSIIS